MSTVISDLEIRLRADIAQLRQDLDRARQAVGGAMDRIANTVKAGMAAFAALAAVVGAASMFSGFVKGAIDAVDAASDIAQKTGLAVEELAALQMWFQKGGMEAGALESSMAKLSKELGEGGKDFERLGVRVKEANGDFRSASAVLADTADVFADMPDGVEKTALAIKLFGKSGADMIPMLNEGADGLKDMQEMADKLGLTFDQKVVDQAGDFNDTLDLLGLAAQGTGRQVAAALLPALQAVVGSFLDFVKDSNMVQKAAEIIGIAFRGMYTSGVSVITMFKVLGKVASASMSFVINNLKTIFGALKQGIMGEYRAAWDTLTKGGKASATILTDTYDGVAEDLSKAGKAISAAWSEQGNETVAAMATLTRKGVFVSEAAAKAAKEAAAEAKRQAEAYRDLLAAADERVAATAREVAGLAPLTEAQRLNLALDRQIAEGKLKLSAAQEQVLRQRYAEIEANMAAVESQKAYAKMLEESGKLEKEMADMRADEIRAARDELDSNEKLVKTFDMTESAIARVEVARLKEQLAQRSSLGLTLDEIEHLETLVSLKERSADAIAQRESLEEIKEFWSSVDKTAHDTFVSILDGGKDLGARLKDTLKNTFFDWLYQMTLKKWIINIQTSITSVGGAGGSVLPQVFGAAGVGGGAGGSLLGTLGSVYGAVSGGMTLAGGLGTGFMGSLAGGLNGAGIGSGLTSALGLNIGNSIASVVGPSVATGISSALSGLAAAAPWAAGAAAVYTIGKKAFGRGPKEYSGNSTLNGTLGAAGFSGTQDADWIKKGGWFRSDKRGVDKMAVDAAMASGLASAYDAIKTSSADFARVLGVNAEQILNRTQTVRIALGKDEAANEKAIAEFFTGVADTVAREIVPDLARFQQAGESAAAALERVVGNFQAVDLALTAFGVTSAQALGAVGVASIEARERLVALAGGAQALVTQAQFYADNFLTTADKIEPMRRDLEVQLSKLGYTGMTTTEQFKAAVQNLVQSGALATAEGAATYAQLMQLAPAFKSVADYLKELNDAAREALRNRADASVEDLQRAVDAQKDTLTRAYEEAMDALEAGIDGVNGTIERTGELSRALRQAIGTVDSPAQQAARRMAAQAQIEAAVAIARAGGPLPTAEDLADALDALRVDASGQFSTLADYQREVARTNAQLQDMGAISDDQLGTAERQLRALYEQRDTIRAGYDAEVLRLDGLVSAAQNQLAALDGVRTGVTGVTEAVNEVRAALLALGVRSHPPAAPNGPVMYAPPQVVNMPAASGTMNQSSAAMLAALQSVETRMANVEQNTLRAAASTTQLAQQFDQVSAGGNALATEVM